MKIKMTKNPAIQGDINGLRGISVAIVVLFHFNIKIFSGGFIGVDLFFVISGFLMTKIITNGIKNNKFSYIEFILKRAKRIFPAVFFLILALALLGVLFLPPIDLNDLGKQIQQALIFNSNNYFSNQNGYFSSDIDNRWLLHTWSLAVEWQFYMLYPIILWSFLFLERSINFQLGLKISTILLFATFTLSLAYCIFGDQNNTFYSIYSRSWQMIAGGLAYIIVNKNTNIKKYSAWLSYLGLAGIVFSLYFTRKYGLGHLWPSYFAIAPVISISCILAASYESNFILNFSIFQKLGAWSYSIYLWHWPIVIAFTITGIFAKFGYTAIVLGLALSILFGYMSYRWVEPGWKFEKSQKFVISKILLSMTALYIFSFTITATDGLIFRVKNFDLYHKIQLAQLPYTFEPSCENNGPDNNKFCNINPKLGGKKILVIGDSHAGHLWPWFKKYSEFNTTFFVKSGCPVIPGFDRADHSRWCQEYSEKAFNLARSGFYNTVIISENWTTFYKESIETCIIKSGKCISLRDFQEPEPATNKMRLEFNSMLQKNIEVVVLDSTPYFNFRVPYKISRDFFWFGSEDNKFDVGDFYQKNLHWDNLFTSMSKNRDFHLVSLRSKLCNNFECSIFDSSIGIPIYIDSNHFNPSWITSRGGVFSPFAIRN